MPPTPAREMRLLGLAFGATLVLSLVVLFLPEAPDGGVELPGADKVVHLLLFGLLATTALRRFGPRPGLLPALAAYAVASEVGQALVLPGRGGDVVDVAADLTGVAVGWAVAHAWARRGAGSVAATSAPDEVTR